MVASFEYGRAFCGVSENAGTGVRILNNIPHWMSFIGFTIHHKTVAIGKAASDCDGIRGKVQGVVCLNLATNAFGVLPSSV